ncbi:MAG: hypothetical protein RLY93_07150 [Sumerlaeia bacterium]
MVKRTWQSNSLESDYRDVDPVVHNYEMFADHPNYELKYEPDPSSGANFTTTARSLVLVGDEWVNYAEGVWKGESHRGVQYDRGEDARWHFLEIMRLFPPLLADNVGGADVPFLQVLREYLKEGAQVETTEIREDGQSLLKLQADTEYGDYAIYLDPSRGYLVRKAVVERGPSDLFVRGLTVTQDYSDFPDDIGLPKPEVDVYARYELTDVEFGEANGVAYIKEGTATSLFQSKSGKVSHVRYEMQVEEFSPLTEDIITESRAFDLTRFPEPDTVVHLGASHISYRFVNGIMVPLVPPDLYRDIPALSEAEALSGEALVQSPRENAQGKSGVSSDEAAAGSSGGPMPSNTPAASPNGPAAESTRFLMPIMMIVGFVAAFFVLAGSILAIVIAKKSRKI